MGKLVSVIDNRVVCEAHQLYRLYLFRRTHCW